MTESLRGRGRRGLPTPGPFVGTLVPGAGASGQELGGTPAHPNGGECADQTGLSRQVIAGSPRGRPQANARSVTSFCWLRRCVGMGVGRREARGRAADSLKPRAGEGPNSGAAPTRLPFDWVGHAVPSGRLYLRAARRCGLMRPWALSSRAELAPRGSPPRGLAPCTHQDPAQSVLPRGSCGPGSGSCAGGNSGQAGFLGMCLRC